MLAPVRGFRYFLRILRSQYPALAYSKYRYYFYASLASVGATQITQMGQGWLIYELSGSALMLGLLGFCIAAPNLLITLFGGVLADRLNKKFLLAFTAMGNGVVISWLAVLVILGMAETWHVLATAALMSLVNGLDWPVRVAIYPQLVPRRGYLSAIALNSFVWQVTRMVAPAIGGFLLKHVGTGWMFAVAALGFAAMTVTMLAIRVVHVENETQQSPLADLREGVVFAISEPLFRYLLLLTFVSMLFCNSHVQIMPIFVELLDGSETAYGLLLASGGLGAIVGAALIGGRTRQDQIGSVLAFSALIAATLTFLFALATYLGYFAVALVLQFASAVFVSIFTIGSMTVLQLRVPNRLRGRVMGIHAMGYSMIPLGGLIIGYLVELSTVLMAMGICCGIYVFAVTYVMSTQAEIRKLRFTELSELLT